MPLVAASHISFSIGQTIILSDATLSMEPGERVGLVGRNGAGKSTLMKIIAGQLPADGGTLSFQRGARVGYLEQETRLDPTLTLRQEASKAFAELSGLHDQLDALYHEMEKVSDELLLKRLLDRQVDLEHKIEAAGGYAVDHRIEEVLHGLGFDDSTFSLPVSGLSGGQRGRLALGKLLIEAPDLLLLDEPTNHLDIEGRQWLEDYLTREFTGAVLMVSHDRYLLDHVVTSIEEVEQGRLINYPGNYTAFREIRAHRRLTQNRAYEKQQTKFKKEEQYIAKYKAGQRAKQAQGRLAKLDRAKRDEGLERPAELASLRFSFPPGPRAGDLVVVARNAGKWYEQRTLFKGLDVTISRGERWGIIGPNGAGKTTLVRALLDQIALSEGTAKLGANVVIGYYSQTPEPVDESLSVYQYLQWRIRQENPSLGMSEQQARDLAGAFLFSGREQDKPLLGLSGGERSRARLAALLSSAKNLLVLDEPTNHLDISSAERLEEALTPEDDGETGGGFAGTMILISHDRALIDATCHHLLILDGKGGAEVFHGSYTEWVEALKKEGPSAPSSGKPSSKPASKPAAKPSTPPPPPPPPASQSSPQPSSQPRGGIKGPKVIKPATKTGLAWMQTDRLEKEIEKLTARLQEIDGLLEKEEVYRDAQKCRDLLQERDAAKADLNRHEEEWLSRADPT